MDVVFTPVNEPAHGFPFVRFSLAVLAQVAAAVALFAWLAPGLFRGEMAVSWGWHLLAIVLIGLPLSLFEYFYHRYMLHRRVPLLDVMYESHRTHHGLTNVVLKRVEPRADDKSRLESKYPIEEAEQEEAMHFPFYALSIFYGIFGILIALPLKLLLPGVPVILPLIASVTISYVGYEAWHAILHLPFKTWEKHLYVAPYKRAIQKIYSFHYLHHLRVTVNEAVFGFFGLPVWDVLFGTNLGIKRLPRPGEVIKNSEIGTNNPRWIIRKLDDLSNKVHKFAARRNASAQSTIS